MFVVLELVANSTRTHIFSAGGNATQTSPVPSLIYTGAASETDCARDTIHYEGKSFSFDTNTHYCQIYVSFDGLYDALLTH